MHEHFRELQRDALPSNCTHRNGVGAEPPGCPESGPCERCGGWTEHKRLVAGETASLRADVERLTRERDEATRPAIPDDVRETVFRALSLAYAGNSTPRNDRREITAYERHDAEAWLSTLAAPSATDRFLERATVPEPDGECFVPMGGWTGRRCRACTVRLCRLECKQ